MCKLNLTGVHLEHDFYLNFPEIYQVKILKVGKCVKVAKREKVGWGCGGGRVDFRIVSCFVSLLFKFLCRIQAMYFSLCLCSFDTRCGIGEVHFHIEMM